MPLSFTAVDPRDIVKVLTGKASRGEFIASLQDCLAEVKESQARYEFVNSMCQTLFSVGLSGAVALFYGSLIPLFFLTPILIILPDFLDNPQQPLRRSLGFSERKLNMVTYLILTLFCAHINTRWLKLPLSVPTVLIEPIVLASLMMGIAKLDGLVTLKKQMEAKEKMITLEHRIAALTTTNTPPLPVYPSARLLPSYNEAVRKTAGAVVSPVSRVAAARKFGP